MDAQKSDADASFLDVYALSGSDWSPMGVVANRYVTAIRKSELFAEWRGQGLSEEAIIERARQDGLLGSTLAPVDVPGIISLVDKGASRDDVVKFAAVLILGKATSGAKGALNSTLARDELISGLPAGTKITPESVVDIRKLPDGRTVWLETGSDAAGLQHIYKRHEVDFVNKGILRDEIPTVVMSALERGKIVGTNGSANVYRITHNGVEQNIAIGVGSNGFVVRANPVSTWKPLP